MRVGKRTGELLLFVIAACSCAPPAMTFDSVTNHRYLQPITSVLVYANIAGPGFEPDAVAGFDAMVVERFAACGVTAMVLHHAPMDLDMEQKVEAALNRLGASAVLRLGTSGRVIKRGQVQVDFALTLFDVESTKVTWSASSRTTVQRYGGAPSASAFATALVTQLRDDEVLKLCRPDERYPGCHAERRQILTAAKDITDPEARRVALADLPNCIPISTSRGLGEP